MHAKSGVQSFGLLFTRMSEVKRAISRRVRTFKVIDVY